MSKAVTKVQVIGKASKLLSKKRYYGLDPYLFGSIAKSNKSSHDVDIMKPTYGTLKQNKRFVRFTEELSKELKGFPVQAVTFRIIKLRGGQVPYDFKHKRGYIRLREVI